MYLQQNYNKIDDLKLNNNYEGQNKNKIFYYVCSFIKQAY